jgi:sterol 3beta-glucosyltransferase
VRITILTWSTRGEVQPYAALAHELERRGHRVVLAVNENHVSWVRGMGLSVAPLPLDFRAIMAGEAAHEWISSGDTGQFLAYLANHEHEHRHAIADAMIGACAGADAIVSGFLVSHRAAAIAQASGTPFVRAFLYPVEPTRAYASPYLGNGVPTFARDALRLRSHEMARAVFLRGQRPELDELRARLGLPAIEGTAEDDLARRGVRTVHLFDERVLPRPDDWPAHALVGGYCFLPRQIRDRVGEEAITSDLGGWLDSGPPPIFFGFGSTPVVDPPTLLHVIEDVCGELGARALVCAGWSRVPETRTERMLVLGTIDYEAILPRCRAAVHHGGAGTTAASLAAGMPTVICSVFGDQALWGHRVAALGIGATMPFQRLNRARLLDGLRSALTDEVGERVRALGAALRVVDGRSLTAELICDAVGGRFGSETTAPPCRAQVSSRLAESTIETSTEGPLAK